MITEERPESTDVDGGSFLKEPGTFHFSILEVLPIEGNVNAYFKLHVVAIDGTAANQQKKECQLTIWRPDPNGKERAIQTARRVPYRLAQCCCVNIQDSGNGRFTFEESELTGRQFVAEISINAKGYPNLVFDHIWHVDDPAVASVPKGPGALAILPPTMRRKPEDFASKAATSGQGNGQQSQQKPADGTGTGGVDLNDL